MAKNRYDKNLIEDGYIGGKDVAGTGNKINHLGLGYRFNRPFGSVAPIHDYDYVAQRTNEKGERIGLFASDIHKGTQASKVVGKYSPRLGKYATQRKMNAYGETAIARDINNVKKRRG